MPKITIRDSDSQIFRLTKVLKKRHYYHITTNKNWGNKIKLYPRKDGTHRADYEPSIKRTCVSTTIAGCVNAVYPCISYVKKIYVYRTIKKINAYEPVDVHDSYITGEKWLLNAVTFVKVGELNSPKLWGMGLNYPAGSYLKRDLRKQEKAMKTLTKCGCLLKHN